MNLSRKRLSLLAFGSILLLTGVMVPAANAQGLFGSGLPDLPFFGGPAGRSCGVSQGYCDPGGLKLDVGYLLGERAVRFGIDSAIGTFDWRYPVEGVQIGATLQAPLKDDVGVILRGTWLFPSNGKAQVDLDPVVGGAHSQEWSTGIQYYTVDGTAVYPVWAPLNLLAGFRFDSLVNNLRDPRSTSPFFAATLPSDEGKVDLFSYIPYVGVGLSNGGSLRVSFIGTPIFWGDMKFRRTIGGITTFEHNLSLKNAYFAEASAEYGLSVGPGTAAVLAKWTYMHASGNPTIELRTGGAILVQAPVSTELIRQHFYVGGSFALPLPSPF